MMQDREILEILEANPKIIIYIGVNNKITIRDGSESPYAFKNKATGSTIKKATIEAIKKGILIIPHGE